MRAFILGLGETAHYLWLVLCEAGRVWWRQMLQLGLWRQLGIAAVGVLFTFVVLDLGTSQIVAGVLAPLAVALAAFIGDILWAPVSIYKQQEEKITTARELDRTTQAFHEYRRDLAMLVKQGEEVKRRLYDSSVQSEEWKAAFDEWDASARRFLTDELGGSSYLTMYEHAKAQPIWVNGQQGLQGDEPEAIREAWQLVQTRIQALHYIGMKLLGME